MVRFCLVPFWQRAAMGWFDVGSSKPHAPGKERPWRLSHQRLPRQGSDHGVQSSLASGAATAALPAGSVPSSPGRSDHGVQSPSASGVATAALPAGSVPTSPGRSDQRVQSSSASGAPTATQPAGSVADAAATPAPIAREVSIGLWDLITVTFRIEDSRRILIMLMRVTGVNFDPSRSI